MPEVKFTQKQLKTIASQIVKMQKENEKEKERLFNLKVAEREKKEYNTLKENEKEFFKEMLRNILDQSEIDYADYIQVEKELEESTLRYAFLHDNEEYLKVVNFYLRINSL